jgi:hypothetical protein
MLHVMWAIHADVSKTADYEIVFKHRSKKAHVGKDVRMIRVTLLLLRRGLG